MPFTHRLINIEQDNIQKTKTSAFFNPSNSFKQQLKRTRTHTINADEHN